MYVSMYVCTRKHFIRPAYKQQLPCESIRRTQNAERRMQNGTDQSWQPNSVIDKNALRWIVACSMQLVVLTLKGRTATAQKTNGHILQRRQERPQAERSVFLAALVLLAFTIITNSVPRFLSLPTPTHTCLRDALAVSCETLPPECRLAMKRWDPTLSRTQGRRLIGRVRFTKQSLSCSTQPPL